MKEFFAELTQLLDSVSEPDKYLEQVCDQKPLAQAAAESVIAAVDLSLRGKQADAYSTLCKLVVPLREQLDRLSSASRIGLTYKELHRPGFFRARKISRLTRPTRRDLFHVPFEEREKLASQRYSIPGVPCLYLGSSAYVCWEELGRPEFQLYLHFAF